MGRGLCGRDPDGTTRAAQSIRDIVGVLSSGTWRTCWLSAIGIVGRPELLFLDEPTAGFDPEARRDFHDVVHRLADREEATILLTTHDLDEAERLADRILILAGGTIIADGSADELTHAMSGQSEVRWSRDGQRFVIRPTTRQRSSVSCSGSTAIRSRIWRYTGPAWRTRTWHSSARRSKGRRAD